MSTVIKILGTGCPKCKTTTALVEEVVQENNIDATIIKVEDIMDIMKYNVLSTPAVVINEKVTVKGRVPSKSEVLELINAAEPIEDKDNGGGCCSTDSKEDSCCDSEDGTDSCC